MTTHSGDTMRHEPSAKALAGLVVLIGFAFNFVARGVADTFMVFLLPLEAEFGWSRSSLTGVYSAYLLTAGLAAPIVGHLFDRYGPRLVYGLGLVVLGSAMLLASRADMLWQLYAGAGILAGIGVSALGMVTASSLISRWFRHNMATAIGIAYAGFGSGLLLIVPLVQVSINNFGWRDTYAAMGAVLLALLPLSLVLPWRRIAAGRAQISPAVVPGAPERPEPVPQAPRWTLSRAIRTRAFWALVQVFFFTAAGMFLLIPQTVAYLVSAGYSPVEAATAFGFAGMLSVIGVVTSGWLADRLGFRLTATISFCGTVLGALSLLALSYERMPLFLFGYMLLFGLSQGGRGPIVSTLTQRIFAGGGIASIFGTIFMMMSCGSAFGSWLSGILHDVTGSYRPAFLLSVLCVAIAAVPFWTSPLLERPREDCPSSW